MGYEFTFSCSVSYENKQQKESRASNTVCNTEMFHHAQSSLSIQFTKVKSIARLDYSGVQSKGSVSFYHCRASPTHRTRQVPLL